MSFKLSGGLAARIAPATEKPRPAPARKPKEAAGHAGISSFSPAKAGALASLGAASKSLSRAATTLKPSMPELSLQAGVAAKASGALAANPPRDSFSLADSVGRLRDGVNSLAEQAREKLNDLSGAAKDVANRGVELLQKGAEQLRSATRDVGRSVLDEPIDGLSKGKEVTFTLGGEVGASGKVLHGGAGTQMNAKVKADDDGGYTLRITGGGTANVGAGGEVKKTQLTADLQLGADATVEFKVKPVYVNGPDGKPLKGADGKEVVDDAATKAKLKKLAEALTVVGQPTDAVAMMKAPGERKPITAEHRKLIEESYVATEVKGTAAQIAAAKLGLPNVGNGGLNIKGQGELTLRIEKGEVPVRGADGKPTGENTPGFKVTTSVSMSAEASEGVQAQTGAITSPGMVPTADKLQAHGVDSKQSGKVTLSNTYEIPGESMTQVDLQKSHATTTLTTEMDIQGAHTSAQQGDAIVATGSVKDTRRIGATLTTTITVDGNIADPRILELAQQGDLKEAAKLAGKNAKIKIEGTVYEERTRSVEVGIDAQVVSAKSKAEVTERNAVTSPVVKETDATTLAEETARLSRELSERLEPTRVRPPVLRG